MLDALVCKPDSFAAVSWYLLVVTQGALFLGACQRAGVRDSASVPELK